MRTKYQPNVNAFGIEHFAVACRTEVVLLFDDLLRVAARHPIPIAGIDRPVGLSLCSHLINDSLFNKIKRSDFS